MDLIKLFKRKRVPIEVGDLVKYQGVSGIFRGKVEKIVGEVALVRCFVMGSEVTQWIGIYKLRHVTTIEKILSKEPIL